MVHLDASLNNADDWATFIRENKRRIEVDLLEVERVLDIARRTPGLSAYEAGFHQLSIYFHEATRFYQQNAPDHLADLVAFWERYRAVVIQRYTGVTPVELRAADKVVGDVFGRFLDGVPNERIAYSKDAKPLVFGGEGGLGAYFTHPPGLNRPFAIINLPHAAFDNVWQWLALPHETGHDLYASVEGLPAELEDALAQRMRLAVQNGEVTVPAVDVDLTPHGVPHRIKYDPDELLATIWRHWANEAQSDVVALLSCGGAAAVALQQIIGFSADDRWELRPADGGGIADAPEEHPTSYVREALNIAALRRIGHDPFADELQARFEALRPPAQFITWRLADVLIIAQVPINEMVSSAAIAAEVLVDHQLTALGGQSYAEIASFTAADQATVDAIVGPLLQGDPTFAQRKGASARHALAATVLALEQGREAADVINRTFKHFV